METLGLGSSAPRSDSRLKALLWPTIRHDGDLEYIAEQGFWICLILAVIVEVTGVLTNQGLAALFECTFYALAAIGVRQRSFAAALIAFLAYLSTALIMQRVTGNGLGVLTIVFLALLLANVRGI